MITLQMCYTDWSLFIITTVLNKYYYKYGTPVMVMVSKGWKIGYLDINKIFRY